MVGAAGLGRPGSGAIYHNSWKTGGREERSVAVTTNIPCTISAAAKVRIAELGIEHGFEQMLEHALQCVPALHGVEVTLEPAYDEDDDSRIVINAAVGYRDGDPLNPGFQVWVTWVGRTISPDVSRHVTMLLWDERTDER
jgi:hypothetical protein